MLLKIWRAYASFVGMLFIVSFIAQYKHKKSKDDYLKQIYK